MCLVYYGLITVMERSLGDILILSKPPISGKR
jgi:hypothetical protein